MTRGVLLAIGLMAAALVVLADEASAGSASRGGDRRPSAESYRVDSRARITRDHHRGRSFAERRSRLYNPSYLRREDRRRALGDADGPRRGALSNVPPAPGSLACRTMAAVEMVDGRRALVSQRECIDGAGTVQVSPSSRKVVRFYDE